MQMEIIRHLESRRVQRGSSWAPSRKGTDRKFFHPTVAEKWARIREIRWIVEKVCLQGEPEIHRVIMPCDETKFENESGEPPNRASIVGKPVNRKPLSESSATPAESVFVREKRFTVSVWPRPFLETPLIKYSPKTLLFLAGLDRPNTSRGSFTEYIMADARVGKPWKTHWMEKRRPIPRMGLR